MSFGYIDGFQSDEDGVGVLPLIPIATTAIPLISSLFKKKKKATPARSAAPPPAAAPQVIYMPPQQTYTPPPSSGSKYTIPIIIGAVALGIGGMLLIRKKK